jgi:hypothetical protein
MLRRSIFSIACLVLLLVTMSGSALAGPPWPAEVVQIRDGDLCYFPWFDNNLNPLTLTGPGMWVVQYKNGVVQWNCHTKIDFTNPELITVEEICAIAPWACNGNGSLLLTEKDNFLCTWGDLGEYTAYNNFMMVAPSGQVNISCHFKIAP